ncbi:MAG: Kae1-associated serine/threonine protein kinase [Candidatus Aenigmarchaeota archaeon]|nr:Kae1-associated serine/threonine protein kinase [Candidatus Aenigmarchaeota archaeon]
MKVLKRGAEATIYESVFDGQDVIVKERSAKRYRIPQIDAALRSNRTRQEIKLMREARGHGVMTPKIVHSDEALSVITMEKIGGIVMKDFLLRKPVKISVCRTAGEGIGKMHAAGMVHGDLTTSNMIVRGRDVFFIDFGLGRFSRRVEDMATDLGVLREALVAGNYKTSGRLWSSIVSGYRRSNPRWREVMLRMGKIESRGRYKSRAPAGRR